MADKFSKVKHMGVIIWRGFSGFWIWRAVGIRTGSRISEVQYTREWGQAGWGRVTRWWLAWGATRIREWGQVGFREVRPANWKLCRGWRQGFFTAWIPACAGMTVGWGGNGGWGRR